METLPGHQTYTLEKTPTSVQSVDAGMQVKMEMVRPSPLSRWPRPGWEIRRGRLMRQAASGPVLRPALEPGLEVSTGQSRVGCCRKGVLRVMGDPPPSRHPEPRERMNKPLDR